MRIQWRALMVMVALVPLVSACGGGSGGYSSPTSTYNPGPTTGGGQANTVIASTYNTFDPTTLTIPKGTTVTFTFQSVGHNVYFDAVTGAPPNIPDVTANASVTRTFSTSGTFGYECHVHPGMRGTIVVQ
ncbi:MAG: plastocyanin/azurin family copper-binding protein [Gemmatimonadota bacterium]|nr:plastocyanin/azurin family copper-binding protein [Gemmatimonadota bacterium]